MIVVIEKFDNIINGKFNGPLIDISSFKTVTLENLYVEFSAPVAKTLVDLSCSLIDKSPGNPHQLIGSGFLANSSKYFWLQLTSSHAFNIQCHSLEESSFEVLLSDNNKNREVTKIRLTLKFHK